MAKKSAGTKKSQTKRRIIFAALLVFGILGLIYWLTQTAFGAYSYSEAFSKKGNIVVSVVQSPSTAPIPGATVSVAVVKEKFGCPTSTGQTIANGTVTFVGCPAYPKGRQKYKVTEVSASGWTTAGSNSYRKAKNGFWLNVRGKKGSKRVSKITVYMVRQGSAPPTCPGFAGGACFGDPDIASGAGNIARSKIVDIMQRELKAGRSQSAQLSYMQANGMPGSSDPWCAWFVSFVWKEAGIKGGPETGCSGAIGEWAKPRGQWHPIRGPGAQTTYTPKPGDAVIYAIGTALYCSNAPGAAGSRHVGIVERVNSDGTFDTIDGNVSDKVTRRTGLSKNSVANGGEVLGFASPVKD